MIAPMSQMSSSVKPWARKVGIVGHQQREVEHRALAVGDRRFGVVRRDLVGEQRLLREDAEHGAVGDDAVEAVIRGAGSNHNHLALVLRQAAFAGHQRVVVGEEGTELVRAMGEHKENIRHETGAFLDLEDLIADLLGQVVQLGDGKAANRLVAHRLTLHLGVYRWGAQTLLRAPPIVDSVKPWEHLATAPTPDGYNLELWQHDRDYAIRADGYDLMVSRAHQSEDQMMALACPRPPAGARVLVGGLGMGYTLRAVLDLLPSDGVAVVSELIPEVVEWNRGVLGPLAGNPLDDPRTEVEPRDVAEVIQESTNRFDAILLDVDNGPDAPTQQMNARIYTPGGLEAIHQALRAGGALAVWSVDEQRGFERRLQRAGFEPRTERVRAHGKRGGSHYVLVGIKR